MSFCPKCGADIESGSLFCMNCGAELTQPEVIQSEEIPSCKKKSPSKLILGIVAAVALVVALLLVFTRGGTSPEDLAIKAAAGQWDGLLIKGGDYLVTDDLGEFSCTVSRDGAASIWVPKLRAEAFLEFYIQYNPEKTESARAEDVADYCFNIKMYSVDDDSPVIGTAIISEDTFLVDFALDSGLWFLSSKPKS